MPALGLLPPQDSLPAAQRTKEVVVGGRDWAYRRRNRGSEQCNHQPESHVTQLEVPWLPGLCLSLGGGMASLVGDLKLPPSPLQSDRVLQTLGSILRTSFQGATSSGDFSQAYCKSPTP
jgi:hypothetical protein